MEDDGHDRPHHHRKDVHEHSVYPAEADVYNVHHGHIAAHMAGTENTTDPDTFSRGAFGKVLDGDKAVVPKDGDARGIEKEFDGLPIPPWQEQLTVRALVVSIILGTVFSIITHRLNLTVGIIPSLNVSAGLLGFCFIKFYTSILTKFGFKVKPFTRQENTVIQTCVVSCYGLAFSGGFGSYLLGMSTFAYETLGPDEGNTTADIKDPQLGWIFAFIFTVSFLGIFALVPLRKIMIIDYKLIYPSGTATAVLINSFHTPAGAAVAKKQVKYLGKYFTFSFAFSFFKWFFTGDGSNPCGFDHFPTLGIRALTNTFNFDFNMTYVGAGMICPHIVNVSVLFGAIVSFGLMWPLINNKAGDWYDETATGSNFKGLFGYKVFISIALILGDGLYHFVRVTLITIVALYKQYRSRQSLPTVAPESGEKEVEGLAYDERRRNEIFMKDGVPYWFAMSGYCVLAIISIIVIPHIFSSVKWYYVLVAYIIAPVFAFCNAYGMGLTDWSLASNYGKILLFIFATWAGSGGGGIIAGLAACGVMMSIVSTAADLMQDFKTGYLTLSSPRSMFISQLVGAFLGCIIAPSTFWLFYKAFDVGAPNSSYQAPFAVIYRTMAYVGVEGFGSLPKHCLQLCGAWFAFAIVVCALRDFLPRKYTNYIPIPMAMAIPFYIGAYFAIDMFIGTVIVFIWERRNRAEADTYTAGVASGLICGDGLWTIPSAILQFAKVNSPICMAFLPRKEAVGLGLPLYT